MKADHMLAGEDGPGQPGGSGRRWGVGLPGRAPPHPAWIATAIGAVWGAASFNILWGYTFIQLTRPFVDSLPGLLSLLPVRVVLYAIHLAETQVVHHSFSFSRNHQWIGLTAVASGALIGAAAFFVIRSASRLMRGGQGWPAAVDRSDAGPQE